MKKQELTFNHERDTKGAVRYQEEAADGQHIVGTLYIRKDKIDGERPDKLKVVITEVK